MNIMSAGPTSIREDVKKALVSNFTNSDLDKGYIKLHRACEKKISKLLNTKARSFIMLGEAMLGLDGACASFIERGDRVLVLVDGIFSKGFLDFVELYEGEGVALTFEERSGIDLNVLENFLKEDSNFKSCFFVHCETPYGISCDIHGIGKILNKYGILSIVDSVSGLGGEYIDFDEAKVDCLIGGTQKCLSAPPGLTLITLSKKAEDYLKERKTKVPSFYGNFQNYIAKGEFEFPYTPCDNLVYSLDRALDNILSIDSPKLHKDFADATRKSLEEAGLEIYAKNYRANTVTTVLMPQGKSSNELLNLLQEKSFILSGGMGPLNDKAFRIGHMGNNIWNKDLYIRMLEVLNETLLEMGVELTANLAKSFIKHFNS